MVNKDKIFKRTNLSPGFSLVEVVLIVAIISLISVTVGVSLSTLSPRELETEVQKLVGDLAWARSMAISTHYHYLVDFDIDSDDDVDADDLNTYIIYKIDFDPVLPEAPLAVKRRVLDIDSIFLTAGAAGPTPLLNMSFMNPQGNLDTMISDPVTIQLQKGSAGANITIRNLTGYISWQRL